MKIKSVKPKESQKCLKFLLLVTNFTTENLDKMWSLNVSLIPIRPLPPHEEAALFPCWCKRPEVML